MVITFSADFVSTFPLSFDVLFACIETSKTYLNHRFLLYILGLPHLCLFFRQSLFLRLSFLHYPINTKFCLDLYFYLGQIYRKHL